MSTFIPGNTCPHCTRDVSGNTSIRGSDQPTPGSLTVCFYCAGVSEFDADLRLVAFDTATIDDPKFAKLLVDIQNEIRATQQSR